MNWFLQQVFCYEIFVLASSTSSARDNWLEDESPDRMPRQMTASSLCLSVAIVKPHHELDVYVSFAMTTAL